MPQAARIERMGVTRVYDGTTANKNGKAVFTGVINRASADTWRKPLKVREPSIFFVNSMSDFFHENARDEWRVEALDVMRTTRHQYQVLTKRPENIAPFLERTGATFSDNVWLGATVERHDFTHRIDTLRAIPAHIRFLSVEPLIGHPGEMDLAGIHWVIGGGESGTGAREMKPEWIRAVRDQCVAQRVPFFFKQWGLGSNNPITHDVAAQWDVLVHDRERPREKGEQLPRLTHDGWLSTYDSNGKGGSRLDLREWKEYPPFETRGPLI